MLVQGKALGRRKPLFADWSIPIAPEWQGDEGTTLRQLITRIVQAQVRAFRERQTDQQVIRVLTSQQIVDAAAKGKISSGQSEVGLQQVDEGEAIGAALQAFEDGLYLVAIDGSEYRSLDQQLYLRDDSSITFIRLTLLAGG